MITSETTRIGEYVAGWHEGTLAIMTVDEFIELQEFDDSKTMYPVNSIWDVKEALSEFEKKYGFQFNENEIHDFITFGCLSSIFQDRSRPFKWEDVLIFRDNELEMCHCQFGADDEEFEDWEFNCHLLGEPLNSFVEELTAQKELGDIHIKEVKVILMNNKASKPKRQRTRIPRGMRHEVFKRDNYTCVECGARKSDGATLHVNHKVPVSKGGTDELDNLQTLCSDCNLNKSDLIQ